jgi:hypothetical protein
MSHGDGAPPKIRQLDAFSATTMLSWNQQLTFNRPLKKAALMGNGKWAMANC